MRIKLFIAYEMANKNREAENVVSDAPVSQHTQPLPAIYRRLV